MPVLSRFRWCCYELVKYVCGCLQVVVLYIPIFGMLLSLFLAVATCCLYQGDSYLQGGKGGGGGGGEALGYPPNPPPLTNNEPLLIHTPSLLFICC